MTQPENNKPLRVWIWCDESTLLNYSHGLAVVVAHDEAEAMQVMKEQLESHTCHELRFQDAVEITEPTAKAVWGGG